VSVVIFLCGVLVGRGARVEPPAGELESSALSSGQAAPVTEGDPVIDSAPPAAKPGERAATKVESGDVNYFDMLTAEQAKNEVAQPPAEVPDAAAPASPEAEAVTAPVETAPASQAPAPATSAGPPPTQAASAAKPALPASALTIQVAALKERAEADRVARRLKAKGFDAFVAEPAPGTVMFRVRVGQFTDRSEAERVKARLAREEKFKPWITR
jgi:cell division septation protein DedD